MKRAGDVQLEFSEFNSDVQNND